MQKSNSNTMAKTARRQTKSSTTLNRKYVRRPRKTVGAELSANKMIMQQAVGVDVKKAATKSTNMEQDSQVKVTVNNRMKKRQEVQAQSSMVSSVTAKELKERAIQKALASAAAPTMSKKEQKKAKKQRAKKDGKIYFGFGRVMLALACAAATAFAIVYFVNLNMPDISLKVAAMQTGIDASYPGYVPRDYSISSITSENGKVALDFVNSGTGDAFTLVEEASSWDSNALLTNYVKDAFGENYTVVREQGVTIYISGSDAAWVNGGVAYKLNTTAGSLTNKQIKSIAVSL